MRGADQLGIAVFPVRWRRPVLRQPPPRRRVEACPCHRRPFPLCSAIRLAPASRHRVVDTRTGLQMKNHGTPGTFCGADTRARHKAAAPLPVVRLRIRTFGRRQRGSIAAVRRVAVSESTQGEAIAALERGFAAFAGYLHNDAVTIKRVGFAGF
jgi:hypothetical protein